MIQEDSDLGTKIKALYDNGLSNPQIIKTLGLERALDTVNKFVTRLGGRDNLHDSLKRTVLQAIGLDEYSNPEDFDAVTRHEIYCKTRLFKRREKIPEDVAAFLSEHHLTEHNKYGRYIIKITDNILKELGVSRKDSIRPNKTLAVFQKISRKPSQKNAGAKVQESFAAYLSGLTDANRIRIGNAIHSFRKSLYRHGFDIQAFSLSLYPADSAKRASVVRLMQQAAAPRQGLSGEAFNAYVEQLVTVVVQPGLQHLQQQSHADARPFQSLMDVIHNPAWLTLPPPRPSRKKRTLSTKQPLKAATTPQASTEKETPQNSFNPSAVALCIPKDAATITLPLQAEESPAPLQELTRSETLLRLSVVRQANPAFSYGQLGRTLEEQFPEDYPPLSLSRQAIKTICQADKAAENLLYASLAEDNMPLLLVEHVRNNTAKRLELFDTLNSPQILKKTPEKFQESRKKLWEDSVTGCWKSLANRQPKALFDAHRITREETPALIAKAKKLFNQQNQGLASKNNEKTPQKTGQAIKPKPIKQTVCQAG